MLLNIIGHIIVFVAIFIILGWLWQWSEKLMYGQITPRLLDDFVCLLFAVSIYLNIKDYL